MAEPVGVAELVVLTVLDFDVAEVVLVCRTDEDELTTVPLST